MKNAINIYLVLLVLLSGCSRRSDLNQSEYVRFLNSSESGLVISKTHNNITFNARMQTPEMLTLLGAKGPYSKPAEFETDKKQYEDRLNFTFIIEDEGKHHQVKETVFDENTYGQLLSYANTELQNDFELQLPNGEIVPCSIAHVEAANSVQPVIRVALAFNHVDPKIKEYTLVFNDNLFNTGKIKFLYKKEIFDNLPKLKI
jgi:hypothetical protein